jgi:hypothetical protein
MPSAGDRIYAVEPIFLAARLPKNPPAKPLVELQRYCILS